MQLTVDEYMLLISWENSVEQRTVRWRFTFSRHLLLWDFRQAMLVWSESGESLILMFCLICLLATFLDRRWLCVSWFSMLTMTQYNNENDWSTLEDTRRLLHRLLILIVTSSARFQSYVLTPRSYNNNNIHCWLLISWTWIIERMLKLKAIQL